LKTTYPIESTFATVRHGHGKTKGNGSRKACLAMVFKRSQAAEKKWGLLKGSQIPPDVIPGVRWIDSRPRRQDRSVKSQKYRYLFSVFCKRRGPTLQEGDDAWHQLRRAPRRNHDTSSIGSAGVRPEQCIRRSVGWACPVHGSMSDPSRSFSVNLTKGRYHGFKCNSKGDRLELWAAVPGMAMPPETTHWTT